MYVNVAVAVDEEALFIIGFRVRWNETIIIPKRKKKHTFFAHILTIWNPVFEIAF